MVTKLPCSSRSGTSAAGARALPVFGDLSVRCCRGACGFLTYGGRHPRTLLNKEKVFLGSSKHLFSSHLHSYLILYFELGSKLLKPPGSVAHLRRPSSLFLLRNWTVMILTVLVRLQRDEHLGTPQNTVPYMVGTQPMSLSPWKHCAGASLKSPGTEQAGLTGQESGSRSTLHGV